MYEVSTGIMQNIKNEFIRELDNRDYQYTDSAIDEILNEWYKQKQGLLSLLSKHPNWNPERLMIHFDADFSRKLNTQATSNFINWLDNNVSEAFHKRINDMNEYKKWTDCYHFMVNFCEDATYLPENCNQDIIYNYESEANISHNPLTEINELIPELHARVGQKNTRIVNKICSHFGFDKIKKYGNTVDFATGEEENALLDSYDKQFAKYCDALSPIKVTRHTCISLNPIDYLLMSNGNSWRSCHYIGDDADNAGCYSSGTISYMLDKHSIIFYTVNANFNGECIESAPKTSRQVFGYNDFQLLQSRLYPQGNDTGATDTYTDIRNIMQKVVADCLAAPNRWIKKKVQNVRQGYNATCYPDWNCQSALCSTSILRGKENDTLAPIVLGAEPICIECGNRHSYDENINHCDSGYICSDCGDRVSQDDVYWVGDDPYCCNCVTYCGCCGGYERNDDLTWIDSEDRYVCSDCLEYYYTYCDECGEYERNGDVTYIKEYDRNVCDNCLKDNYSRCSKCGAWIYYTDERDDGLCEDCAAELDEEEEDNE